MTPDFLGYAQGVVREVNPSTLPDDRSVGFDYRPLLYRPDVPLIPRDAGVFRFHLGRCMTNSLSPMPPATEARLGGPTLDPPLRCPSTRSHGGKRPARADPRPGWHLGPWPGRAHGTGQRVARRPRGAVRPGRILVCPRRLGIAPRHSRRWASGGRRHSGHWRSRSRPSRWATSRRSRSTSRAGSVRPEWRSFGCRTRRLSNAFAKRESHSR